MVSVDHQRCSSNTSNFFLKRQYDLPQQSPLNLLNILIKDPHEWRLYCDLICWIPKF